MIFTLNEEIHLPTCLSSLKWCNDIIIVDSFSTDRTEEICRTFGARFFENHFEGFGKQRNWALDNTNPKNEWILILDADERVSSELADEICELVRRVPRQVGAYRVRRRFYMWGRWLRYSSLYPTWVVRLIRKNRVHFINSGHGETQEVEGEIRELENDLIDENLKGIEEWFERHNRYSSREVKYELAQISSSIRWIHIFSRNPLARRKAIKYLAANIPGRPLLYFLYSYFVRFGFLEGRDGLTFCLMKTVYYEMISVKKYNMKRS